MNKTITKTIDKQYDGLSIKVVLRNLFGLSKKEISRLKFLDDGIQVNGQKVLTNYLVKVGDEVCISFPSDMEMKETDLPPLDIPILYEDEDIIVVNKPSGIVCHASHNQQVSLGSYVLNHTIRVIGRLDKEVSGIVVYAKNRPCAARLNKQRKDGIFQKKYIALIKGDIKEKDVLTYSLHCPKRSKKREVDWQGRECITKYEVIDRKGEVDIVEVEIPTGKTHQIRAGFAGLGHPLLGDSLYDGDDEKIDRVALHCHALSFKQPFTQEVIQIKSDIPDDMAQVLI